MKTGVVLSFALLGLAACGPEGGNTTPSLPIDYEMAVVDEVNESASRSEVAPEVLDLTVEQLEKRLAAGNIRLIDVRTDEEVAEGMIPGAEHIALDMFDPEQLDLSDGREVVIYCRSGNRSRTAAERMADHTGRPTPHLAGGITAWAAAGNPVETR